MSRIFLKNNYNYLYPLLHTQIFHTNNSVGVDFYKNIGNKGFLLRNIYFYYDFFYYTLSLTFVKKNVFLLNFFLFKNFKNFINYFYNSVLVGNNFIVVDSNYKTYSPFLHLVYQESVLLQYNSFFKKNHFFLKQSHSVILLKRFFHKTKTTTMIILNYDEFYKYLPLYSTFNSTTISFVLPNTRFDLLDFFLFKSNKFFYLERLIFLAKIYNIYSLAFNTNNFKKFFIFKKLLNRAEFYLN
jgi:hypothetical protein